MENNSAYKCEYYSSSKGNYYIILTNKSRAMFIIDGNLFNQLENFKEENENFFMKENMLVDEHLIAKYVICFTYNTFVIIT